MSRTPWTNWERAIMVIISVVLVSLTAYAFTERTTDVMFRVQYVEEIPLNDDPADRAFYIRPARSKWFEAYTLKSVNLRGNFSVVPRRGEVYHVRYRPHPRDQSMRVLISIEEATPP